MHLSLAMRRPPPSEFETYIVSNRPQGCYNPMDPQVECFGLEIAIRNKDAQHLEFLWSKTNSGMWEGKHLFYIMRLVLESIWLKGIKLILEAETSKEIFRSLTA